MSDRSDLDQMLAMMDAIIAERIPFNKLLGVSVESLTADGVVLKLPMRDELIGNFMRGNLHGGVISSVLDLVGGIVAFLSVLKTMETKSIQAMQERFAKLGTIDMRMDFLRPGLGQHFTATGYVLRTGNKVAVTRTEMHNDQGQLIAVGTGAYVVA